MGKKQINQLNFENYSKMFSLIKEQNKKNSKEKYQGKISMAKISIKPRFYQFDFLHAKKLLDVFTQSVEFYLKDKENLKIIDIGCGDKPYFPLLKNKAQKYIGVDIKKSEFVDIVAPAENLPFGDNCFDVALSTQTLEHIKNYQAAVDEMHRVLKPDGIAFLSTIGVWEVHGAPNDYWRFTNYGLEEIFKQFKEVKVINNGGAVLCFFQIYNLYLKKLTKIPIIGLIPRGIILLNNLFGWYLDKLTERYDFFVNNYLVVAKK